MDYHLSVETHFKPLIIRNRILDATQSFGKNIVVIFNVRTKTSLSIQYVA